MGFRFRKSFKIAPGIKVNINKKSSGITIGSKTGKITYNTSGRVTTSAGIPGSGLYWSESSSPRKNKKYAVNSLDSRKIKAQKTIVPISITADEELLKKMSNTEFFEYFDGYMVYAESLSPESPADELEKAAMQLNRNRNEMARRTKGVKEAKLESSPLVIALAAFICVCGIIMLLKSWWGLAFVGVGLLLLLIEYKLC